MRKAPLLISSMLIALTGCSLFDFSADIDVVVPAPPESWRAEFPDLSYSIVYLDAGGRLQRRDGVEAEAAVRLPCSRQQNAPVLAYPGSAAEGSSAATGELRPAGALLRGGMETELRLSWADGAVAEVFRALWESGVDAALINGPRLAERMRAAPDPWTWDVRAIASALAAGEFTAADMDPLPAADVRLRSLTGTWILESPFRPACEADPGGELALQGLSFGIHRLFGGGRRAEVYLDENGAVVRY